MLIKSIYLKVLITALTLSSSVIAVADETKFKVAVVKKEVGIKDSNVLTFNKNMNSCAELTHAKKTIKSEIACTAAITSIKSINTNTNKAKYLESLTYSNRGISRYMNDDFSGAMDDFIAAILIDSNSITKSNMKLIKRFLADNNSNDEPANIAE